MFIKYYHHGNRRLHHHRRHYQLSQLTAVSRKHLVWKKEKILEDEQPKNRASSSSQKQQVAFKCTSSLRCASSSSPLSPSFLLSCFNLLSSFSSFAPINFSNRLNNEDECEDADLFVCYLSIKLVIIIIIIDYTLFQTMPTNNDPLVTHILV